MNKLRCFLTSTLALALMPTIALAQFTGGNDGITSFMNDISNFIGGVLIPFVFAIALLVFIWGVFKYFILGGSDADQQESGKQLMLYAIVGFVLMVSIFGIVNLIADGFGFSKDSTIENMPDVTITNT